MQIAAKFEIQHVNYKKAKDKIARKGERRTCQKTKKTIPLTHRNLASGL